MYEVLWSYKLTVESVAESILKMGSELTESYHIMTLVSIYSFLWKTMFVQFFLTDYDLVFTICYHEYR